MMAENSELAFSAAAFYQFLKEKRLMGSRCTQCGQMYLPPRALCPACHGEQLEWVELSGKGRLATFTSIFAAPREMAKAGYGKDNPYISGIVELDEGVRIGARILGLDALHPVRIAIGTPLIFDTLVEGEKAETVLAFRV